MAYVDPVRDVRKNGALQASAISRKTAMEEKCE
jgi:hypothetical protein